MSETYLVGGDTYQKVTASQWAGQTFRPQTTHTLHWIDLNLRGLSYVGNPVLQVFTAGVDHKPWGDCLSRDRYWLMKASFTPHPWLWYETWGKSLSESHPWTENGFLFDSKTTLKNSQMTIFNDGQSGINVATPLDADLCPLRSAGGADLYIHHCSPFVDYHPTDGWLSYIFQTKKAAETFDIEPVIARGSRWGPWPKEGPVFDSVYTFDLGQGPDIFNLTDWWIKGRIEAELDPDPTDWYVSKVFICNEQFATAVSQTLTNNYVAMAHQAFAPAPVDEYPIKPPWILWPWATYRIRVSMQPVTLTKDLYYVMTLAGPSALPILQPLWQYDKADAQYPYGLRIFSPDSGETWETFPDDDHLFAEFGSPIVPLPPPDPPVPPFATLGIEAETTATGVKFTSHSNTPVHQYLYYTFTQPLKHPIELVERGLLAPAATQYCFVTWYKVDQEEPGDTLIHTFIVEPWPNCETRWYTIRALVNNEWSPSVGPIFKYHRVAPLLPDLLIDWDPAYLSAYQCFSDWWNGNTFVLPFDFHLAKIAVRLTQYGEEVCGLALLHLREEPIQNGVPPALIEASQVDMPDLPRHPLSRWVEFPFSNPLMLAGTKYSFFAVGCSPYYTQPKYRIEVANEIGVCSTCCLWVWMGSQTPPVMKRSWGYSCHHKIWGYPV